MAKQSIPKDVKAELESRVLAFNQKTFKQTDIFYQLRYRGRFCYLERSDYGQLSPIFRLSYNGDAEDMDAAIFKWSTETYDSDDFLFPGMGKLDGTIEGAMRAGLEAYPV